MVVEMCGLIIGEDHIASMKVYNLRNDSCKIVNHLKKVLLAVPMCIIVSFH